MKYVNIEANMPLNSLENRLKKADYYNSEENFSLWSIESFDSSNPGVHLSYDKETKKLCGYFIDGKEHKDFPASINSVFTGKIVEKDGYQRITGWIMMAPIFNIIVILSIIGLIGAFTFLDNNVNVMVIAVIFFIYFIFVKEHYRENGKKMIYFFGECTQKKIKKRNPNKKNGKWARK